MGPKFWDLSTTGSNLKLTHFDWVTRSYVTPFPRVSDEVNDERASGTFFTVPFQIDLSYCAEVRALGPQAGVLEFEAEAL